MEESTQYYNYGKSITRRTKTVGDRWSEVDKPIKIMVIVGFFVALIIIAILIGRFNPELYQHNMLWSFS